MEKEKLINLLEQYSREMTKANNYLLALEDLDEKISVENSLDKLNLAPAFFHITRDALLDALVLMAAKLFDDRGDSYCIQVLLKIAQAHTYYFAKSNHFTTDDSKTGKIKTVDFSSIIESHKQELDGYAHIMSRLKKRRNKYYAHLDKKHYLNIEALEKDYPLYLEEIKKILRFADVLIADLLIWLTGKAYGTEIYIDLCVLLEHVKI